MARRFERLGDPLTLGAGLEQNPHRSVIGKDLRQAARALVTTADRAGTAPVLVDDPNLAIPHVEIDGTIDHGWLLLMSAVFAHGVTPSVERKLPRR